MNSPRILCTICAREGSKGLPGKNIRSLLGKPLLAHSIDQARDWSGAEKILVSTDGDAIRDVAKAGGAEVPFRRPAELSGDTAPKLPVLSHALREAEKLWGKFDLVLDLDATSPIRRMEDFSTGLAVFQKTGADAVFSVVPARKNPYFNMVERDASGGVKLVKSLEKAITSRQAAPRVFELNASMYYYRRDFLLRDPQSLWEGKTEFFEMRPESAFDIDEERDWIVVEALLRHAQKESKQ